MNTEELQAQVVAICKLPKYRSLFRAELAKYYDIPASVKIQSFAEPLELSGRYMEAEPDSKNFAIGVKRPAVQCSDMCPCDSCYGVGCPNCGQGGEKLPQLADSYAAYTAPTACAHEWRESRDKSRKSWCRKCGEYSKEKKHSD